MKSWGIIIILLLLGACSKIPSKYDEMHQFTGLYEGTLAYAAPPATIAVDFDSTQVTINKWFKFRIRMVVEGDFMLWVGAWIDTTDDVQYEYTVEFYHLDHYGARGWVWITDYSFDFTLTKTR